MGLKYKLSVLKDKFHHIWILSNKFETSTQYQLFKINEIQYSLAIKTTQTDETKKNSNQRIQTRKITATYKK